MPTLMMMAAAHSDDGFIVSAKVSGSSVRLAVSTNPLMGGPAYADTGAPDADGWVKLEASGLPKTGERYWYCLEVDDELDTDLIGTVRTLPQIGHPASFQMLMASCMDGRQAGSAFSNSEIYPRLADWHPDALGIIIPGDLWYDDSVLGSSGSSSASVYREHFEDWLSQSNVQAMALNFSLYIQRDDHDIGASNPSATTASAAMSAYATAYRQCVPHPTLPSATDLLYYNLRAGRAEFIVSDLRGARHADSEASPRDMMGSEQLTWTGGRFTGTDAKGMVWVSSSPIIATASADTWSYHAEEIATLAADMAEYPGAMLHLHGDTHCLCADTGANNPFGDFPVFGAAPLDGTANYRGGTHDLGRVMASGAYALVTVRDEQDQVEIEAKGYVWGKQTRLAVRAGQVPETTDRQPWEFT